MFCVFCLSNLFDFLFPLCNGPHKADFHWQLVAMETGANIISSSLNLCSSVHVFVLVLLMRMHTMISLAAIETGDISRSAAVPSVRKWKSLLLLPPPLCVSICLTAEPAFVHTVKHTDAHWLLYCIDISVGSFSVGFILPPFSSSRC